MIPDKITVLGRSYRLAKTSPDRGEIERYKQDLLQFNRNQRMTAGRTWRNIYQFRIKKFDDLYCMYTK